MTDLRSALKKGCKIYYGDWLFKPRETRENYMKRFFALSSQGIFIPISIKDRANQNNVCKINNFLLNFYHITSITNCRDGGGFLLLFFLQND